MSIHSMPDGSARCSPLPFFAAEAVNSIAGTLLTVGLPFYMNHRFGWGARQNFAMAACQGALYVTGALSAKRISGRWGRERTFLVLCTCMAILALAVGISASMSWPVVMVFFVAVETGLMAASWPLLESLVSSTGDPSRLSRRLGFYNITWASVGAVSLAATGAIIQHTPAWVFFGAVGSAHVIAGMLVLFRSYWTIAIPNQRVSDRHGAQPIPDDAVVRQHRLALWLSRIGLPSTYVIVFSLAPALPSLHAIKQLSPTIATLVASIWFIARAAAFVITGHTTFWHKRPWLIFIASVTMLLSFLGTIIPGSLTSIGLPQALMGMALGQITLGLSIGTIYSASLYFGMAVSKGSTEHGGYHEALIGLGQVLGPTVGATTQWIHPGALWPAVFGIAGVVAITILLEAVIGMRVAKNGDAEYAERAEEHG